MCRVLTHQSNTNLTNLSFTLLHRKQQESTPQYSTGLPPLAPVLSGESTHQNLPLPLNLQQQQRGAIEYNQDNVPSQIHLEDEETLTSEVTDNRCGSGSGNDSLMKKVNSMEKLGKLRGQMSVVSLKCTNYIDV